MVILEALPSSGPESHRLEKDRTSVTNCHICGLSFETSSEMLLNHIRAHRKNDDLRRRLLANFGPEVSSFDLF